MSGTPETDAENDLQCELAAWELLREAREDAEHWKIEYEIVADRLRGKKHERDNGIIAEDEIILKLTKERDEAREALKRIYQASIVPQSVEEDFAEWEKAIEMLLDLIKKEAQ